MDWRNAFLAESVIGIVRIYYAILQNNANIVVYAKFFKWIKMIKRKRTYAEFLVPGFFVSESEEFEVKSRDIQNLEIPGGAYALRFFDILAMEVLQGKRKIKVKSEPTNHSSWYLIGVKICTKAEVAEETKKEKGLDKEMLERRRQMLRKMELDKQEYVLKVRVGGFGPLKKGDLVLLLNGKERKVLKVR